MLTRIKLLKSESSLKIAVILITGSFLWIGLFFTSSKSLLFLSRYPDIREDIIYTAASMLFMMLTVMLIFSSATYALGSLFKNKETQFLMATPTPASSVYTYKTLDGLVFSSWAFLALGLPPLLAYGIDVGAAFPYYVSLVAFVLPFALMTSSIGTLLGLLISALVPRSRKRFMVLVGVVVLFICALIAYKVYGIQGTSGMPLQERWREEVLGQLAFLRSDFAPHAWITRGLFAFASKNYATGGVYLFALWSSTLLAIAIGDFVGLKIYARTFSAAASGSISKKKAAKKFSIGDLAENVSHPFVGKTSAMFVAKDLRAFLRDPAQWSQVVIFFGLLGLYILNIRNLKVDITRGYWMFLIAMLNFMATSLTLGTLTTRFVFPQISLEGKRFWVLGLAPIKRSEIITGKFVVYGSGAALVAVPLVVTSNIMLNMPMEVTILQTIASVIVCLGLVGISIGLGALFPNYNESSPSRIVSGFGGTLTLVVSIIYVAIMVSVIGLLTHMRIVGGTLGGRTFWNIAGLGLLGTVILTYLVALLPMKYGIRALRQTEF